MKRSRIIAGSAATMLVALVLFSGCQKKSKTLVESVADIQKRQGVPVTTMLMARGTLESTERSGGTVEGYQQSALTAAIPATIGTIKFAVGQSVAEGAEIMTLDPLYNSAAASAKVGFDNVERSLGRTKALAEQGAVPQDAVDQLASGVEQAKLGLEGARKLESITAPFSGTIIELGKPVNTVVAPGDELVKIASLGRVRVVLSMSEAVINRFDRGQRAVAVIGSDTVVGSVEKVSMAGDESNHVFAVDVVFANPGNKLRPGMYVPVTVTVEKKPEVLSLPVDVIITEGKEKYVYQIENGVAKKAPVALGIRGGDRYEIVSGLGDGAQVVATGASLLSDGAKVNVVSNSN